MAKLQKYRHTTHAVIAYHLGMTISKITVLRNGKARVNLFVSHFASMDDLTVLFVSGGVAMKILFQQDKTLRKWPIEDRKRYEDAFCNCENIDYQKICDELASRKGHSTDDVKALADKVTPKARSRAEYILQQPVYRKMLDVLASHIFEGWKAGKGMSGTDIYRILNAVAVK